jgi:hypothetical protein
VQIIDERDSLPFDVAGIRTIQFIYNDLDSVSLAKDEVTKQMRSMLQTDARIESPNTVAVDLTSLSVSHNPQGPHFREILTALAELKQQVSSLQCQIHCSWRKCRAFRR